MRNVNIHAAMEPADVAFAVAEMTQLENLSTQQRQDLRVGKGIRYADDGKAFSVYGDTLVTQKADDGSVISVPSYQSKEALDSIATAKAGSIGMGKGEYYVDTRKAYVHHGTQSTAGPPEPSSVIGPDGKPIMRPGKRIFTPAARELRKTLAVQNGVYSQLDPAAKLELQETMRQMGITKEEEMSYMNEYRAQEAAGAGLAGIDPGATPPPAPGQ
jgi:hypothetical protein